jgi:hypothetical protein
VQGLKEYKADYVTLDNPSQMAAAANAPYEFLTARNSALIIDEVQLAPELFRTLKIIIDELRLKNHTPRGKFLLTGSANIMALPKLSDALVGRMSILTLYPLCVAEAIQSKGHGLSRLFMQDFESMNHTNISIIETRVRSFHVNNLIADSFKGSIA